MRLLYAATILTVLSLVTTPVTAADFVGINDACPVETPYLPEGAGTGVVVNGSMDSGWYAGVPDGWHGWKDESYTSNVFFQDNYQKVDGCCGERLVLAQPPANHSNQAAGIYQQIHVVPGETYTVSAYVRVSFPPQTYNGEDLLAYVGLDPYGEPTADGGGTEWCVELATQDNWFLKTVSVEAIMPVMTLSLRGLRKTSQHGDGAQVWFDKVTFSGPIPTGPPPAPDVEPPDPESLIPETVGSNFITHGDFEATFNNGIASGWTLWTTQGTGRWKRSNRLGPIGGGNYAWCGVSGDLVEMKAMRSKTHLLLDHMDYSLQMGTGEWEDTIFVGRPYIDNEMEQYLSDPTFWGRAYAEICYQKQRENPRIDCWQALNEPDNQTELWPKVVAFEKAFAERCHELGIKSCVLNLATGNPGNIWRILDAKELFEVADYLGHHTYGGPADELMVADQTQDDPCSFSLRQRKFHDVYRRRGWRMPPVISTESTTYGGWHGRFTPEQIAADLMLYGDYLNADKWMLGTCVFTTGGCGGAWEDWELVGQGVTDDIGVYNMANPVDSTDGLYAQMFGAGKPHPTTLSDMITHNGLLNGGIVQQISGLQPGSEYLIACWMKYEFRGHPPDQLAFYIGVDTSGQTTNGASANIDWGVDQIADKSAVHETYTHVWRKFTPTATNASIWLRANNPVTDPAFMVYVDQVEVRELAPPPGPTFLVSTTRIDGSGSFAQAPAADSFTIQNIGSDTLNYTITCDADWLSITPTTGSSSGEADTIDVVFDVTQAEERNQSTTITIDSPEAVNSPREITVWMTLDTVDMDFDGDGDVDQSDFGHLQGCYTGDGVSLVDPSCTNALLDSDDDVDASDFMFFLNCFDGAEVIPDPTCDD